jgi:MFS transporter, OFA family, oxalate/formate antiporter
LFGVIVAGRGADEAIHGHASTRRLTPRACPPRELAHAWHACWSSLAATDPNLPVNKRGRAMVTDPKSELRSPFANPWIQLILGIICMAAVANLQYGWTLFVNPIDAKFHWGRVAIQVAFTTFVLIETWLVPVEGYLVDRFGPRWVVIGGGILVAIAWVLNSSADSLAMLYFAAAVGGVGTGCVYGTCVGNALKWFPGRRGLAAGFTAAGFGAGAALTVIPISHMITSQGYQHAFFFFGLLQGAIVVVIGLGLLVPPASILAAKVKPSTTAYGYTPREVLRSPVFYVLYAMFVLIAAGGLTMTAAVKPMSADLKIDKIPVDLLGFTLAAGVFAVSLSRIFDGVGRPFFGWLSDRIGREHTMALAFLIGAGALFTLSQLGGTNPLMFVLVTALYFGVYGEIFSLFPATQGDTFGSKYAAANAGMLYTAKGTGALLVAPMAALAKNHGYGTMFAIFVTFNIVAALLALFVLKPMRARHFAAGPPAAGVQTRAAAV